MNEEAKKKAGQMAASRVQDGMRLGVGTGSTVAFFIEALILRYAKGGKKPLCAPTSEATRQKLVVASFPIIEAREIANLEMSVDGADLVSPHLELIKGGGGALFREKIVAMASKSYLILIDPSKKTEKLSGPLPLEVMAFGLKSTLEALSIFGQAILRDKISDNGNILVDLHLKKSIDDVEALDIALSKIPGVVATGLFYNLPSPELIIG